MACVLSISPVYNHNACVGFSSDDGDADNELNGEYDFPWIETTTVSRSGTNPCPSAQCRVGEKNIEPSDCRTPERSETCRSTLANEDKTVAYSLKGLKRKLSAYDSGEIYIPSKRISPFLNTPQECKEEKRRVLKISIQKLKAIEDAEIFLRRSVLINNTMKRLQNELCKEKLKQKSLSNYCRRKRKQLLEYDILSNDCLSKTFLFDDPFLGGDKITDDMTDTLMNNLANKLGVSVSNTYNAKANMDPNPLESETVPDRVSVNQAVDFSVTESYIQENSESSEFMKSFQNISETVTDTTSNTLEHNLNDIRESVETDKLVYEPSPDLQLEGLETRSAIDDPDTHGCRHDLKEEGLIM